MADVYDQCEAILGEDSSAKDLLRCVVNTITNETSRGEDATAFAVEGLLLHSAVLVFLMQAGFAMLVAGSVRSKNVGKLPACVDIMTTPCPDAIARFLQPTPCLRTCLMHVERPSRFSQ